MSASDERRRLHRRLCDDDAESVRTAGAKPRLTGREKPAQNRDGSDTGTDGVRIERMARQEVVVELFGLSVNPEIDIGHLLTFVTLLAGFLWWLYSSIRDWRTAARKEAESGALRLLLWLLRERQGSSVGMAELRAAFNAENLRDKRIAYCKQDFVFATDDMFERAVYQLDWEGKIDFVGAQAIAFRVDRHPGESVTGVVRRGLMPTPEDRDAALRILREGLRDPDVSLWKMRDTVRTAFALAPEETATILRTQLNDGSAAEQRLALELLGELFPRD